MIRASSIDSLSSVECEIDVEYDNLGNVIIPNYDIIDCMSNNELVAYLDKLKYGSDQSLKTEFDMRNRLKLERVRLKNQNQDQTRFHFNTNSIQGNYDIQRAKIKEELMHCSELATKIRKNEYFSDANQLDKFVEYLDKKINNFEDNFTLLKNMLNKEYYPILVTGEVSSGKSTFINLLLNEDLLPTAYTAISSTLCEIRHVKFARQACAGSERSFVLHPRLDCEVSNFCPAENLHRIAFVYPIKPTESIIIVKDSDTFVEDMSNYLGNLNDRSDVRYQKIELFISNKKLENGLCIVDSPGFSENDAFNQMLRDYFKNALAFIYIIKTTTAGGIQENGLERVIREIREICLDGQCGYRWDSAIFVFNMWDEVKSNKVEILKHLKERLYSNWTLLKETQIFTLSSKSARYLQKHDLVAEDLQPILDRVKYLLETAVLNQYTLIFGAMMQFARVSIQLLDSFLYQIKVEQNELKERYYLICSQLNQLKEDADLMIQNMRQSVTESEKEGLEILCHHLKMPETQQRIIDKMVNFEPPSGVLWWQIETQLRDKVAKVIKEELCKFECDSPFFHRLRQSTFQRFREAFADVEAQVNELERALAGNDEKELDISDLTLAGDRPHVRFTENKFWEKVGALNTSEMIAFGVSMPLLLPLAIAAGMIALPVIGVFTMKEKLLAFYHRRRIERYNSSDAEKVKLIKQVTRNLITRYHKNSSQLKAYVYFEMSVIFDILKQLQVAVDKKFQDDKDHIYDLMNERRDKELLRKYYEPLREIFKWKRRTLLSLKTLFLFSNMMDIPVEFLEKGDEIICHGLCADLFQGRVRKNPMIQLEMTDVSVRRLSFQIDAKNIEKYLKEEEFYKFQNNKHILRARAVAKKPSLIEMMQKAPCNSPCDYLLLLCEPVSCSLRHYLQKDSVHELRCDLRFIHLSNIIKQILNGLSFLHSRDCKHYDLTLDTLATIVNNSAVVVKLTNIRRCVYFKEIAQIIPSNECANVRNIAHLDYEIIEHVRFLVDNAVLKGKNETKDCDTVDKSIIKSYDDIIKIYQSSITSKTNNSLAQIVKEINRMEYSSKHDMYSLAMIMYEAWTGYRIENEWYEYWKRIEMPNNDGLNHSLVILKSHHSNSTPDFSSVKENDIKKNAFLSFNESSFKKSTRLNEQNHHQIWLNSIISHAAEKDRINCSANNIDDEEEELEEICNASIKFNTDSELQNSNLWLELIQSCWTSESERFTCEMLSEKLF